MSIFNLEAMATLNDVARRLLLEIRNSPAPVIRANIAVMDFEQVLDLVLPLGEPDALGRDPDNLRRSGK